MKQLFIHSRGLNIFINILKIYSKIKIEVYPSRFTKNITIYSVFTSKNTGTQIPIGKRPIVDIAFCFPGLGRVRRKVFWDGISMITPFLSVSLTWYVLRRTPIVGP